MEHTLERSCMLHGSAQRRGIPVDTLCDHFNPKRETASQQAVHTAAPEERLPHSLTGSSGALMTFTTAAAAKAS